MLHEITILNANEWQSPEGLLSSRPRFITKYELEFYPRDGGETSVDGESAHITAGLVSFSRPGQVRFSRFPFLTTFIYFDLPADSELGELTASIPTFSCPGDVGGLFGKIMEYNRSTPVRAEALLIELLFRLHDNDHVWKRGIPRRGQAELYRAIGFMKSNLDRQITSAEMAAAAGYSVSRFSELFGEFVGMTPLDYFRSLRLGEAKRRLISGKKTSEVACELGFATVSHFCGAFRREFGMTPGEFVRDRNYIDYEN